MWLTGQAVGGSRLHLEKTWHKPDQTVYCLQLYLAWDLEGDRQRRARKKNFLEKKNILPFKLSNIFPPFAPLAAPFVRFDLYFNSQISMVFLLPKLQI
jgi:hypothetical protein